MFLVIVWILKNDWNIPFVIFTCIFQFENIMLRMSNQCCSFHAVSSQMKWNSFFFTILSSDSAARSRISINKNDIGVKNTSWKWNHARLNLLNGGDGKCVKYVCVQIAERIFIILMKYKLAVTEFCRTRISFNSWQISRNNQSEAI